MAQMISGRDSLRQIDGVIVRLRDQVSDAIEAADAAQSRRAEVRQHQVSAYKALADLRLDQLARGEIEETLFTSEQRALDLLAAHQSFIDDSQRRLDDAAAEILKLEQERADLAAKLDAAIDAYETRVEETELALKDNPAYRKLKSAFEETEAVSERAHSKLAVAREDRKQKGARYEKDPLFLYLWERGFRTPAYRANPFIRFMDGWVARLCGYDAAHPNYRRLTDLPERLSEHADRTDRDRDVAESLLEDFEARALEDAGALELQETADKIREGVEGLDHLITKAETHHQELVKAHEGALASQSGPAAQARNVLEQALKTASFPDLRILASQTVDQEDDHLIDQLVKLRAEDLEFELSARELEARPAARRLELELMESFRRAFKSANYDSAYARFRASAIDSAISGLLRGGDSVKSAMRYIQKNMERSQTRVDPGFGGGRRADTLGLPGVLGEIAVEIAKEAARQGGDYGGYRGPRRPPWRVKPTRRSFPSTRRSQGPRRRGGFKTGGGF